MVEPLRILIVDDEPISRALVRSALAGPEFVVEEAESAVAALAAMAVEAPDLLVCDLRMPGMGGCELVQTLRRDPLLRVIPVILLTAQDSADAEVLGLEAGADDYVVKPVRPREFRTRVHAQIRRRERDLVADPFTHLPSGTAIHRELVRRIAGTGDFAAIYADLDHFKPYVDRFGFLRAGEVIRETARLLFETVRAETADEGFVGHIAGDDFLAICEADRARKVCDHFTRVFDLAAPSFYPAEVVTHGGFEGQDREGRSRRFSLLTVSLTLVDSRRHRLHSPDDFSQLASDARTAAKALPGSSTFEA